MTDIQVDDKAVKTARVRSAGPSFWERVRRSPLHDYPVRDRILEQYAGLEPGSAVLELGPGSGYTAFRLSSRMDKIAVVDIARHTIADLEEQLGPLVNVRCIHADTAQPGFASRLGEQFDVVYALDVFEYVPRPAACAANLVAALRPGGLLFLTFPNFAPPEGDGVTHFSDPGDLDQLLHDAGLREWKVFSVRLNRYAQAIFRAFHEFPLSLYRRLRSGQKGLPQTYEATWAFQNRTKLRRYRALLHFYWEIMDLLLAFGGPAFVPRPMTDGILSKQLVVVGRK